MKKSPPEGYQNDPVYIIGNPRSGTSLLRLMLTCHPDILIPPEGHFFLWLEDKYGALSFPHASQRFIDELVETKKFETWGLEKQALEGLFADFKPVRFRDAIALVYCAYGLLKGRTSFRYWGDKNKLWKEKLPAVLTYYPDAKFIHIVRDGRDVACSFKELTANEMHKLKYGPNMSDQIESIAERWATNITFIQQFLGALRPEQHVTVRYEDLVTSPKPALSILCEFLHLEFSDSMVDYADRNKKEKLEPEETMHWKKKLNGDLDIANISKYKYALTPLEISTFEEKCGGLLGNYGYK